MHQERSLVLLKKGDAESICCGNDAAAYLQQHSEDVLVAIQSSKRILGIRSAEEAGDALHGLPYGVLYAYDADSGGSEVAMIQCECGVWPNVAIPSHDTSQHIRGDDAERRR